MKRGRRHYSGYGNYRRNYRSQMEFLLARCEFITKSFVEDGDQLEAKKRLDAGKHHAAFFKQKPRYRIQRKLLFFAFTFGDVSFPYPVNSLVRYQVQIARLELSILASQIEEFFISYNRQRGKKFKVIGTGGPKRAIKFLKDGIQAYKKKHA
jgi:hypothetical protein